MGDLVRALVAAMIRRVVCRLRWVEELGVGRDIGRSIGSRGSKRSSRAYWVGKRVQMGC